MHASITYWAVIFSLGFILGTARTVWGGDAVGESTFILIEIPIILAASWIAARRVMRRMKIDNACSALAMGALAFALLMASEMALAALLAHDAGRSEAVRSWLASLIAPPGLYGFLGQIAFGLIPRLAARGR
ncbi:hypothetical protein [Erythrobacter sp. MTPC3]|uniref:hypothetical protein n=1 Tax=Erythrobacter sp. MTPC3 TaxID=3056564 RepID=UPI0036F383AE